MKLEPLAHNVWSVAQAHAFMGLHVGTRMTVVKLSNGKLLLHSPIPINDILAQALAKIGDVAHIVCPNLFHHVFAADVKQRYPNALLHGPIKLQKKRADLRFDSTLNATPHADWADDFQLITIDGSLLHETVFFHRESGTLIAADLIENFHHCDHTPTRWYLKLGGLWKKPGWHPLLRMVYVNRRKARADVEKIMALPINAISVGHGEPIKQDAKKALETGLRWLL